MAGFFSMPELQGKSLEIISSKDRPKCGSCGLFKKCESPKLPAFQAGEDKKLMIVSESPGEEEDKNGRLMTGRMSKDLLSLLKEAGIQRDDFVLQNALICHPKGKKVERRHVDYCRPNLLKTIEEEKPKVIILIGLSAIRSLIPYLWKDHNIDTNEPWIGWQIPSQKINAWVCPTHHPSIIFHLRDNASLSESYRKIIVRNFRKAKECLEYPRPWKNKRPVSEKDITILYKSRDIKREIQRFIDRKIPVAFDYETNCLKPDNKYARIICVSMSDGTNTIVFKVTDEVKLAFANFLQSDCPKVGHNTKFEDRWSWRIFKVWPNNVIWCGQTNAHILNNTEGTTSLKFQSFVRFGQPDYDEKIKPFLYAETGYDKNRIDEVSDKELLLYCGYDSFLEWWEYYHQSTEARIPVLHTPDEIRLPYNPRIDG